MNLQGLQKITYGMYILSSFTISKLGEKNQRLPHKHGLSNHSRTTGNRNKFKQKESHPHLYRAKQNFQHFCFKRGS